MLDTVKFIKFVLNKCMILKPNKCMILIPNKSSPVVQRDFLTLQVMVYYWQQNLNSALSVFYMQP